MIDDGIFEEAGNLATDLTGIAMERLAVERHGTISLVDNRTSEIFCLAAAMMAANTLATATVAGETTMERAVQIHMNQVSFVMEKVISLLKNDPSFGGGQAN